MGARALQLDPRPPATPFLKWAGGKAQLLPVLTELLPHGVKLMRHVEPFVGGGALFFSRSPERALLSDINPALIATYQAVQKDVGGVVRALSKVAAGHSREAYLAARERFNRLAPRGTPEYAALFIYLNKTCFNGLFRVNKRGAFNVPPGNYPRPNILDVTTLVRASEALAGAALHCDRFESMVDRARPGDFVYLDPPYAPASATANFTQYSAEGFTAKDQARVRDVFVALTQRGSRVMVSNSDVPLVRSLYAGYPMYAVQARRSVNSQGAGRGAVGELVIRNY